MGLDKNRVVPNSTRGYGDSQRILDEIVTCVSGLPFASPQACDAGLLVSPEARAPQPPRRSWESEGKREKIPLHAGSKR